MVSLKEVFADVHEALDHDEPPRLWKRYSDRRKPGCTYFITDGLAIKIGHTTRDISYRLKELQAGNPKKLILMATIDGNQERELHAQFASHHLAGEWFQYSPVLIQWIEDHAALTLDFRDTREALARLSAFCARLRAVGQKDQGADVLLRAVERSGASAEAVPTICC